MKISISILLLMLSSAVVAQETKYAHCNCIETKSESTYTLKCGEVIMEEGNFTNGKREGSWTTRNKKGKIIIKADYKDDKLNGIYEQYHYKGILKLKAQFSNGFPDGNWTYYSEKGKVIKEGIYNSGVPIGQWKIFDKKGKKVIVIRDFDNNKDILGSKDKRYFEKKGIVRDDESGGWMVLLIPNRSITNTINPLGSFLLAGDIFMDYVNIPYMFFDTYTHYDFIVTIDFNSKIVSNINIELRDKEEGFDSTSPSFPFLVKTGSQSQLSRVDFSKHSLELLKGRIKDVVMLSGPWILNDNHAQLKIQVPFVLNDIKNR